MEVDEESLLSSEESLLSSEASLLSSEESLQSSEESQQSPLSDESISSDQSNGDSKGEFVFTASRPKAACSDQYDRNDLD